MVEVLSGETFADFLKSRIWNPFKMANTYLDIAGVERHNATERLARAYRWDEKADCYVGIPWFKQPEAQGSGSVYSSVKDYAKWIQAMINRTSPLPPTAYKELIKPRTIIPEDEEDRVPFHSQPMYALGWVVETYRGRQVIGHGGSDCGFESLMQYLPELGWGIVVFGNSNGAGNAAWILYGHLVDELLGVPNSDRFDWDTLARERDAKDKNAEEQHLFSEQPNPSLPMSAPLPDFTGRYHNSGYHDLVPVVKDGKLQADCSDRTLGSVLIFEHVSGNAFVAEMQDLLGDKRRMKAEFLLDEGGHVRSLGVAFVAEMEDERIWFRKIE
jgi:CubicO group peptidase (beta-lactamase class C family)